MARVSRVIKKCVGCFLLAFFVVCSVTPLCTAATINGWDYSIPDYILTTYQVGNYHFDQYGRIASFTSSAGAGSAVYTNPTYDSMGNLISNTIQVNGIPAIEGQTSTMGRDVEEQHNATYVAALGAKAQMQHTEEVVSANILRSERRAVEGSVYNHLRSALIPGYIGKPAAASTGLTGVASGDAGRSLVWSMWLDGSLTTVGSSVTAYQTAGTSTMALAGVECAVSDRFLFGLGFGYSGVDTSFHNGSGATQHDYGFILNPYLGYSPIDNLLLSVQGGLTFTDTNLSGQGVLTNAYGFRSRLSYDSHYGVLTSAIGGDVSYAIVLDRLVITPHAGYSYSNRQPYGSGVSTVQQGILNGGGMIGYNFDKLTPFVSATYNYDTIGQTHLQRDDMQGAAGLTFRPNDRFQATASVANTFFRYQEYETTFDLNLRYTF